MFVDSSVGRSGVWMLVCGWGVSTCFCVFVFVFYTGSKGSVKLFIANNCTASPCGVQRLHNASIELEFVPSKFSFL